MLSGSSRPYVSGCQRKSKLVVDECTHRQRLNSIASAPCAFFRTRYNAPHSQRNAVSRVMVTLPVPSQ